MKNFKPILFSTPMVKAIMEETKTQTRRICKVQPDDRGFRTTHVEYEDYHGNEAKPKYKVGDIMWVRETFAEYDTKKVDGVYAYKANNIPSEISKKYQAEGLMSKWKPSIFMPK